MDHEIRRDHSFTQLGALLLAAGLFTFYQQLVVRASRDAVINARVAVIRAPIDGIATAALRWIAEHGGPQAVNAFAAAQVF